MALAIMPPDCIFDLETRARPDAAEALAQAAQPERDAMAAPSNWKDPVKIAAYIAEKRAAATAKMRADAALDPDTAELAAVRRCAALRPPACFFPTRTPED